MIYHSERLHRIQNSKGTTTTGLVTGCPDTSLRYSLIVQSDRGRKLISGQCDENPTAYRNSGRARRRLSWNISASMLSQGLDGSITLARLVAQSTFTVFLEYSQLQNQRESNRSVLAREREKQCKLTKFRPFYMPTRSSLVN